MLFGHEHVATYLETDGEVGHEWLPGVYTLLLTTTGHRSGEPVTTPLIYRRDGDAYAVVASNGGADEHPAWYRTLDADPAVTIRVGRDVMPATARTVTGDDRAHLWPKMTEVWPAFDDDAAKTDRHIPVVAITPRTWRECSASAVDDLTAALEAAPDAAVPAYPSWTVRDLAVHVVRICTIAAAALRSGVIARPEVDLPVTRDSSPDVLGATLRDALQQAFDALDDCPQDRVWGAGSARHPSFWGRRLLREAVLHRWDAQQAATGAHPPERAVALELIDEFLATDVTRALAAPDHGRCGELTIRAGERRWTVDLADGTVHTGRHDSPGRTGATIHGDPASVWLWLVRRRPLPAAVEFDDVDGVVASFTELVDGFGRPD